ncbi:hypothetical protein L7F22_051322 [Adiantum nelumboides]|nr:hypothetical protein [Adiantum nelumboides]
MGKFEKKGCNEKFKVASLWKVELPYYVLFFVTGFGFDLANWFRIFGLRQLDCIPDLWLDNLRTDSGSLVHWLVSGSLDRTGYWSVQVLVSGWLVLDSADLYDWLADLYPVSCLADLYDWLQICMTEVLISMQELDLSTLACKWLFWKVMELLLENDADVDELAVDGKRILHMVVNKAQYPYMELLLQMDDFKWTPLHVAAFKGLLEVLCALLEAGANLQYQDAAAYTLFNCVVMAGNKDIVKLLLKHGA